MGTRFTIITFFWNSSILFVLLGLKLLIPNTKSIGNYVKYTLLALWIFSLVTLTIIGIKYATELSHDGKAVKKNTYPCLLKIL